jgi:hypothetical protein
MLIGTFVEFINVNDVDKINVVASGRVTWAVVELVILYTLELDAVNVSGTLVVV